MKIVKGGLLTTVQDLGRYGYQKIGVTTAGAMDTFSLRLANILVGNPEGAAALEITLQGPVVEFTSDALVAVTGAELAPKIADVELPQARAVAVRGGSVLTFGRSVSGCRAYLAVAGGIDVPVVMGSRSTDLRGAIGGYEGRALGAGDRVAVGPMPAPAKEAILEALSTNHPLPFALTRRYVDTADQRARPTTGPVKCVRGPHFDHVTDAGKRAFFGERFQVSTQADRMGYRLVGPDLSPSHGRELLSSAVTTGAVQLPPGGEAIVLMAERQTTGGYPVIAQVITTDLPLVAQLRPGDTMTFAEVGIPEAQAALRAQHRALADITKGINDR
ncbi:MAG TPA: biotin-dependent carboxyltransferase family protein [Actinomycetota bacterium]|nr:biotin-dependent carboxyltransferase family protein [Actinomycetota bacterium]